MEIPENLPKIIVPEDKEARNTLKEKQEEFKRVAITIIQDSVHTEIRENLTDSYQAATDALTPANIITALLATDNPILNPEEVHDFLKQHTGNYAFLIDKSLSDEEKDRIDKSTLGKIRFNPHSFNSYWLMIKRLVDKINNSKNSSTRAGS
ncbi:hypothetical protein GF366_01505 [Candidatus Peregrinibacteria bacterium]|nr:hypothetical protein [Candidatus Peregrinibacteria bacterium]